MTMLKFEHFTNRYELSKTLKRELKPVWETGELLEKMRVIAVDKKRKESYDKVKTYIDKIHRKFKKSRVRPFSQKKLLHIFLSIKIGKKTERMLGYRNN